ncbi:hypothetical protein COCON_G00101890 [Conger conger]|uniref:CBFA2/RUNX1 partner transcriptional co-repressor 3 n=1 Tax=Conger conger TaxID=82655 RepID=A0A9Q1DHW8_CONCO|nr:hypothetical protein COCON_G00101890 [Conger conger]
MGPWGPWAPDGRSPAAPGTACAQLTGSQWFSVFSSRCARSVGRCAGDGCALAVAVEPTVPRWAGEMTVIDVQVREAGGVSPPAPGLNITACGGLRRCWRYSRQRCPQAARTGAGVLVPAGLRPARPFNGPADLRNWMATDGRLVDVTDFKRDPEPRPPCPALSFSWGFMETAATATCHCDRQGQIQLQVSLTVNRPYAELGAEDAGPAGVGVGVGVEGSCPSATADREADPAQIDSAHHAASAPAVSQAANRSASFTPTTMLNGSSHSPTALNGAPSTPNGFSNGPAMSSTASLSNQQLPPACGARQLCKLKRFLTTLQQFGNDISPEIGSASARWCWAWCGLCPGTVLLILFNAVSDSDRFSPPVSNSTLTIEEFHGKLQEATNFPLRPFVIPFLKANLPLLQRELLHCARMAKQTPAQYLAQHEQLLLDANASSPLDSSEILLEINEHGKRRTPDRTKDSSVDREAMHDMALAHHYRDAYRLTEHRETRDRHRPPAVHGARQEEVIDHRLTDREWAEEWKHLDNLLNCIMDMVEKTRRSLTVLRRCQEADREEMNHWIRRYSDVEDMKKPEITTRESDRSVLSTHMPEIHRDFLHRPSSGYLPEEIWRKAGPTGIPLSPALKQLQSKQEEAVNEVKRQALSELQKAVSDAERKAHEMISVERSKMERVLAEAKRQASEDALTVINQQEDSSESCWNCGRKASETCSGCNTARYCGSFCQHKDWEKHHHVCGLPGGSRAPQGTPCSSSAAPPRIRAACPRPRSPCLGRPAGGRAPASRGARRNLAPAGPPGPQPRPRPLCWTAPPADPLPPQACHLRVPPHPPPDPLTAATAPFSWRN